MAGESVVISQQVTASQSQYSTPLELDDDEDEEEEELVDEDEEEEGLSQQYSLASMISSNALSI